jgi:DNA-directed RNA polymerase
MRVAEDDRTLDRAQLLRTFHKDVISAARHAISTGQMAPALKGLNALQSVPFKINTWIMDVIARLLQQGHQGRWACPRRRRRWSARAPD